MPNQFSIYQYKDTPLVTVTKGPPPTALPEYAEGWGLREQISPDDIGQVATTPSKALAAIEQGGAVTLDNFDVVQSWREKWAPNYDPHTCSPRS